MVVMVCNDVHRESEHGRVNMLHCEALPNISDEFKPDSMHYLMFVLIGHSIQRA